VSKPTKRYKVTLFVEDNPAEDERYIDISHIVQYVLGCDNYAGISVKESDIEEIK